MLNILLVEKTDNQKMINNFLIAIGKGIITNSTKKRLDELEILQLDLDSKIIVEKSKLIMQLNKDDILNYLQNALKEEPLQMIELLIK